MWGERLGRARDGLRGLRSRAEGLAERLPGLLVEAERVAATVAQGVHGRRRTGIGETFWQFRTYQPGDDARGIDWRQSARADQTYFVREQEWEAAESVWLWCDTSASMRFRSQASREGKQERALLLALALAALLVRAGERVALLGSGHPPAGGRFGLERLFEGLERALDQGQSLPPAEPLPGFARLVLLSDFYAPLASWQARLRAFDGGGRSAALLQIVDPMEEELAVGGRVLFEGPEAEGRRLIGQVEAIRQDYRRLFEAHRGALRDLCQRRGWRFAVHRTDRSGAAGLLGLYEMLAPSARAR